MKYGAKMDCGVMIYIPNFTKIRSGFQNLIGGIQIYRQYGYLISLLLFFKNKKRRRKIKSLSVRNGLLEQVTRHL
jgi:hypothetical protein